MTFAADSLIVATSLGGAQYTLSNYSSQTFNGATTGAGGLDTGSMPTNSWVGIYAIYNPTTGTASILGAVTATPGLCPTIYNNGHMPSGYTASALIAIWPTNGSAQLIVGYVLGRHITILNQTVLNTSTPEASFTSLSLAASTGGAAVVPPSAKTVDGIFINALGSTPSAGNYLMAVASDAGGAGEQNLFMAMPATSSAAFHANYAALAMPTAQTLYWASTTSGTTPNFTITVTGYSW